MGEYFLNISKENLKIAALRGKIKLENVQLDGDLIGSHVLGAVGLSGFGVLSCWARSVRMVVSWKNLDREPTRFEIRGVHLVCVPLLQSTGSRMHGVGTSVDPHCNLRTRAKRSALARLERNFFSGRIPGEGPPPRRLRRMKLHGAEKGSRDPAGWKLQSQREAEGGATNANLNSNTSDFMDSSQCDTGRKCGQKGTGQRTGGYNSSVPSQDWKAKLRSKFFRNIEIRIRDIHLRCEVLDLEAGAHPSRVLGNPEKIFNGTKPLVDKHAFAFGLTLDSFVIKTADENWESESAAPDPKSRPVGKTDPETQAEGENHKLVELNNLSIYWDDEPPLLISESDLLRSPQNHNLPPIKLQGRVAAAMEAMVSLQDPGGTIRKSLTPNESRCET